MAKYTLLELDQQVTKAYVDSEGELITLYRPLGQGTDGAGGFTAGGAPTAQAPRRRVVTAVAISVRSGNTHEFEVTDEGQKYKVKYVIVGTAGDDMQAGDTFTYRGLPCKVIDVHSDRTVEVRGQVIELSSP